jgi:hypothetical protein
MSLERANEMILEFKSHGFGVDSMQQFIALRNNYGEVLLVWTSAGMDLNKVLTSLKQITPTVPHS